MASKQTQEASGGYMDGVRVKISEKYKPPPRIGLAMSYAQRLTLNKQMQDTIPSYEFVLERTVIEKMKEWKTARTVMFAELNNRVEEANSEFKKQLEDRLEYQQKIKEEESELSATTVATGYIDLVPSHSYQQTQPMLMPTQVTTASRSTILTPIPLKEHNYNQNYDFNVQSAEKSPFNISDFEADTSSPFDNMELKSINDMEELAQVLKGKPETKPQVSYTLSAAQNSANLGSFPAVGTSFNSYNIPSSSNYIQPVSSAVYTHTNGYYYPPETIQTTPSFNSHFHSYQQYNKVNYCPVQGPELKNCSYNNVPDIIKSLQTELDNTHLDSTKNVVESHKAREVDAFPKVKTKSEDLEEFYSLPKNLQDMAKLISSMGFPLSRVARVCRILGDDQKKIVEHLLAMSDLLDLGFPEVNVSKALLQCDNNRDKALDILIS